MFVNVVKSYTRWSGTGIVYIRLGHTSKRYSTTRNPYILKSGWSANHLLVAASVTGSLTSRVGIFLMPVTRS